MSNIFDETAEFVLDAQKLLRVLETPAGYVHFWEVDILDILCLSRCANVSQKSRGYMIHHQGYACEKLTCHISLAFSSKVVTQRDSHPRISPAHSEIMLIHGPWTIFSRADTHMILYSLMFEDGFCSAASSV